MSCNNLSNKPTSYWEAHKEEFKYQNKTEFISDSTLESDLKSLRKIHHRLFSNIGNPVYLYSWHERDPTKIEFSVVHEREERGPCVHLLILNKNDSLLTDETLAGVGNEGGYLFETRSRFVNKDTLISIGATTQWLDFEAGKEMKKMKGDSTFSYLIIDTNGKVTKKIFKEVKEINFRNE